MTERSLKLTLATALAVMIALPASADKAAAVPDLLRRALTPPASTELFAYDFEDVSTGDHVMTIRGRVDPSRKEGDRVEITHASNTDPKEKIDLKKIDERYERNAEGDIFCDSQSEPDVTQVVDKGMTAAGRLFTFIPRPPKDAGGDMKGIMKKVLAEAVVDEATATMVAFNARLTKPHSMMLVAKVNAMNLATQCQAAPNGRAYAARREMKVAGSGMGRSFDMTTVQTISNLRAVR